MFPDLILPTPDFENQLGACVNAMSQDDAIGQILVFERMSGTLHMRHIDSADLVDTDIDDYEMVVFDGGNTSGDTETRVLSASARALLRVPSLIPPAPFEGLFLPAAQENGCGAVPFPAGRQTAPGPCLPHVRRRCRHMPRQSRPSRLQARKPCWSFLPTDLPRPSTPPTRDLSLAGNPLFFLKEFPHGSFPHQIHDAFAGRRPCAPQRAVVQVPRVR